MTVRRKTVPILATALGLMASAIAAVVISRPADAADSRQPIMFGAAAGNKAEILDHERVLGRRLEGVRVYKLWSSTLFGPDQIWARDTGHTLFLSIKSRRNGANIAWRDIANASSGSQLHSEMLGHAKQIKAFGAPVYITFNHEPEAGASAGMGTGADFAAAWRKLISTYRQAGVTNARYVWNMTAYAFARRDAKAAGNYYPGDAYVDHIAADGYNWYACRGGSWKSLASIIEAHRQFGLQHPGKGLMLYEWSSTEDPGQPGRKAAWFREATELFKKPGYGQYKAVLQWSGRNNSSSCGFDYATSASAADAWRDMGNDPAYTADSMAVLEGAAVAGTTVQSSAAGSSGAQQPAVATTTTTTARSGSKPAKKPAVTSRKSNPPVSGGGHRDDDSDDAGESAAAFRPALRTQSLDSTEDVSFADDTAGRQSTRNHLVETAIPAALGVLLLGAGATLSRWTRRQSPGRRPSHAGAHRRV